MKRYLSRKKLQKILKYDPNTGIFYHRKLKRVVGTVDINGNVQIRIEGIKYMADKLAWFYVTGVWSKYPLIHLNGIKSDNWLSNLKMRNIRKTSKNNKSGITGVSLDKRDGVWRACISLSGKQINLGNYKSFDLAVLARFKAEKLNDFPVDSPAHQYIKTMFF